MRLRHLLLGGVIFFLAFDHADAQVTKYQFSIPTDSLAGFDEAYHKSVAAAEGLYGDTYIEYIAWQKRSFIDVKYGLTEKEDRPGSFISNFRPLGGGAMLNNAPCQNEDFELGNMNFWTASRGKNTSSQVYPTFTTNISAGTQVTVMTTPLNDPFVGTIPNSPLGGSKVLRINNTSTGTGAVIRVQQTFSVTTNNYLFDFAYWAVMHNAVSHNCTQTPYMAVRIRNFTGTLQACPNFSIVAPSTGSGGCAGIGPTTWTNVGTQYMTNTGWQKFSIDLTPYMGQNVTVEAYVAHCSPTAHFGYAYFDADCNTMNVTVNGQPWSMPTAVVNPTVICGATATMVAPNGLSPYQWFGPPGSGINGNTSQTIVTTVPGAYTLNMSPSGICNPPMQKIVNLSFVPPTTVAVTPGTICASGNTATLSAQGTANYTWNPGGMTGPTATVSPGASTIYTLTAQSGTCLGNFTVGLEVAPDPTVFATASNPTVCSGGGTTLTAIGANTYTWMPGSLTGSQVAVNPTASTIYTVTGSNPTGCSGTATVQVNISGSPTVSTFPATSPTVCAGTPVTLVGLGAINFSWYPTSPLVTGQVVSLTPTVTTQYTVIGSNGSCTNSALHTITVDPGPSVTISASPTITCPGVNATLTATAPSAIGFTWNPGGSNSSSIVVNPITTTVYTVNAVNASGCRSTYTFNKLVAPVPSITVTPATSTVCVGSTLVMTATGGSSYTWNPGNVQSNTIGVSPAVNTTYTVTASNGTCTSTALKTVTVVPLPTVNASATSTNICRGQTTTLSAAGATSYTWQPGASTSANFAVSPTVTTTYTLFGRTSGCTNSATITIVVRPQPTVVAAASPTAVCPGFCSTLSATGANTYTFSGGTVVCPTVTTTYSVTGTGTNGCVNTTPALVSVSVNPTPNIVLSPSSASVCLGSSVTVNASGAVSFTWNPGNLTGASRALSPAVTTVFTVSGTNAQGCVGQRTIQISVVPLPTVSASASPTVICSGQTVTLSASGATTYTWMPGTLTGATRTVAPTVSRIYTVTGNTAGCVDQETVSVTVNPRPNIGLSASPASVCPGFCSTLIPTGGTNYTFSPSGPTVCPANTGTYTVNGINAFGCTDLTPPVVTVVVNTVPGITLTPSSASLCSGGSVNVTATGANTFTWQPGNVTGSSRALSPSVTTIYTVSGTNSQGCVSQQTIQITVVPNPTITASASSPTVCQGSFVSLFGSGATSYTWQPVNLVGGTVGVSPSSSTTYTVSGSTSGCSSVNQATVTVTVFPTSSPGVSVSPSLVCGGGCASLSVVGYTGSVQWFASTLSAVGPFTINTGGTTAQFVHCGINQTTWYRAVINSPCAAGGSLFTSAVQVSVDPVPITLNPASSTSICSGGSVNITASGANSYTWNPGNLSGSSQNLSPSSTTVYTVSGTNSQGCIGQNTVQVAVISNPTITASASPSAPCAGNTVALSASGATGFTWMPGGLTGANVTVSPVANTVYTVTGAVAGCTSTTTVNVNVISPPTLLANVSPTSVCAGNCATLNVSGGTSYTWMPGNLNGASAQVCPTVNTTYTVTGSNAAGCTTFTTVTVVVAPGATINASASSPSICSGANVTLTASGGTSYTWMPGNNTSNPFVVSPTVTTVYTVTGINGTGCVDQATIQVIVQPLPSVNASASPASICAGNSSTLSATGASSYVWTPGNLPGSSVVVSPGITTNYTVTGTSAAGCSSQRTVQVVVNPKPTVNASASQATICAGGCTTLTATGASNYTWLPGNISGPTAAVCPTTNTNYTLIGFSGAGCSDTAALAITVNPVPVMTIAPSSQTICQGNSTTLVGTGTGVTSLTWMPGNFTGSVMNVSPSVTTVYTLTGTNASNCSASITATVVVLPAPVVSVNMSAATVCATSCSTLTASGASTYTWSNSTTGSVLVTCPVNTTSYSVIGTNAQGCSGAPVTVTVNVNPLPSMTVAASPASICAGSSSTLTATGANVYTWQPGSIGGPSLAVSPSSSTTYSVTGFNSFGCATTQTVAVTVNPVPGVTISASTNSVCFGLPVVLTALGGTSYTWQPGGQTSQVINVNPTITTVYTVTGNNSFGCSGQDTHTINVIPPPNVTASSSPTAVCAGSCATLTASGATSYTWLPGFSTGSSAVFCPTVTTTYTVVGQQGLCGNFTTITVPVNQNPTIFAVSNPTQICLGNVATLNAGGGVSYTWTPGNLTGSSVTVSPNVSTTYTVAATNGTCSGTSTVFVAVSAPPSIGVSASSPSICAGKQVTLTATGGSSYSWQPVPATGASVAVTLTSSTVFTVTGTSGSGCTATATIPITVVANPTVAAIATQTAVCPGVCTTLSGSGATSYTWLPMNTTGTTATVCPLTTSSYTLIGSSNTCTSAAAVSVVTFTSPVISISASPATVCPGGSSTLTANGASSFTWMPGGTTGAQLTVNPSATTIYTVTGVSGAGCSGTATIAVQVNPNPTISVSGPATVCAGSFNALSASGASGNSYTWQPGNLTGSNVAVSPLATTVYTVTGALNNCTATATHTLVVNPLPTVFAQATPASICTGGNTTLSATGAANYTWQPVNLTGSAVAVFPTASTIYTVTASSAAGCSITQTVGVTVSSSPSITISSSNNTLCAGGQATLTASGTISYTWLPISSGGSVVVVSPGSTTTYTVLGSNGPGCSTTATFVQAVSPVPTVTISAANNTVCSGFATTLTASGATSYTWEPGSITTNPAVVTVTATTIYTVSGETAGCAGTSTIQINASPAPTVNAVATPTSICAGGTVTLSASGAQNYTWYPVAVAAPVITDNPSTTTTYTVIGFSASGCPGFTTITVPVLQVPQLTLSASSASVCLGSTGTLTATGAQNYTWQPGNMTGSVVTISPLTPTTYTVVGDNGACQGTNTVSVGINQLPAVSANVSPTVICAGNQVTLTAGGAVNYTWQPGNLTGQTATDTPTISTAYTVTGEDANGCSSNAIVSLSVNPFPVINPVATPTGMCEGSLVTATLSVSGNAATYTWLPSGSTATIITDTPTATTVYTVSGTDAIGCVGTATVMVGVYPIPTLAVSPLTTTICAGTSATLTASGASNYQWLPGGGTNSVEIVSPGATTQYTVIGDNGGLCADTAFVDVFVTPGPSGVTASSAGTITCANPSAVLTGTSTSANVSYSWAGPSGYSSTVQSPTVTAWGVYTLIVTDNVTGCVMTATVDVPTDNSIPSATIVASGSITCSSTMVLLDAIHTTTSAAYSWNGPGGFTASSQQVSVALAGDYTLVITDLSSSCTGSAMITVGTHTDVTVTASITAATCSAGISLNDGTILAGNFGMLDRFDLVAGSSYTGSATYTSAITIPSSGIITSNLANPADTTAFTLRIFDSLGCVKDFVLELVPTDCTPKVMGIAKAVSTATNNGDGTYRVLFTVVVNNADSVTLTNVVLEDNLAATFPAPATFTRGAIYSLNPGNLQLNSAFDGTLDTRLTTSLSVIPAGTTEFLLMEVMISPNGNFGPFSNSISGSGLNGENVPVNDISTTGSNPDPDGDGNPRNNSEPTTFSLTPQQFFGLTKVGSYVKKTNNTYDVSYTVTAHNLGNDTVKNVVITDSLFNATVRQPATYTLTAGPTAGGQLVANSEYDGRFDIRLVNDGVLAPGTTATVSFTINVVPDTVTVLVNSARGVATGRADSSTLTDISNNGTDPDSNDNGVWNEEADNLPTVVILPPLTAERTPTVFVPEGFSPDGDGINDYFVIKGLPETGDNVLTVFNRWGNRVFHSDDYDNSWNGYPNVPGTLGKDKLPPGTYYFVIEFKGSGETRTGFVVLQY